MNSKRICIITEHLSTGGTERAVINLAQALTESGYEVHVALLRNIIKHDIKDANFSVHHIDIERPCYMCYWSHTRLKPQGEKQLREAIEKLKAKILALGPFDLILSNTIDTDYLCIKANLDNLYCTIHADPYYQFRAYRKNYLRMIKKYLSWIRSYREIYKDQNIITVSEGMKDHILSLGIKPKSIKAIYNIFNFEDVRDKAQKYEVTQKDYVLYVGRITLEKNIPLLLKSYAESKINQQLLMLGADLTDNKLIKLIAKLGIDKKVTVIGFTPNPYPYIKQAKAAILSSRTECLPTVLIEALILGTPAVSTNCPTGPKEILTDELAKFLSPPGKVAPLAKNIRSVIENPPRIEEKHLAKFSQERNLSDYISLLNG